MVVSDGCGEKSPNFEVPPLLMDKENPSGPYEIDTHEFFPEQPPEYESEVGDVEMHFSEGMDEQDSEGPDEEDQWMTWAGEVDAKLTYLYEMIQENLSEKNSQRELFLNLLEERQ